MEKSEATDILDAAVEEIRGLSFDDWRERVRAAVLSKRKVKGAGDSVYEIEVQAIWVSDEGDRILVSVQVDHLGPEPVSPVCRSFLVAEEPD